MDQPVQQTSDVNANPLLDFSGLPRYDKILIEHITSALNFLISQANTTLQEIKKVPESETSWAKVIAPLDYQVDRLAQVWGIVEHLNSVMDTPALREVYQKNLIKITKFYNDLLQDVDLFAMYSSLLKTSLSSGQKRVLENARRDAVLGGVNLTSTCKEEFASIKEQLAQSENQFSKNVLDATNYLSFWINDPEFLRGIPSDSIDLAVQEAQMKHIYLEKALNLIDLLDFKARGVLHCFTLQLPSYFSVMQYAQSRELRKQLYHAYVTRASAVFNVPVQPALVIPAIEAICKDSLHENVGEKLTTIHRSAGLAMDFNREKQELSSIFQDTALFDNTQLIHTLLHLRQKQASLLGYKNFSELSVYTKMADSPSSVISFLADLAKRAKPFAEREFEFLKEFSKDSLGINNIESWDYSFLSEKLKQSQHGLSDEEIRQYFPFSKVLSGLFDLVEKLFSITVKPDEAPTWHPTVTFYRIEKEGKLIGQFYLDPYARSSKRSGAWMSSSRTRCKFITPIGPLGENDYSCIQTPVACLVCNFKPPTSGASYLTHEELITLFHEFGHGLHHLLSEVDEVGISGTNGVEWDAVELPSQFMENFCWEFSWLQKMSCHSKTAEMLPSQLFNAMWSAKNFQSGLQTLRQVEFALFDIRLHCKDRTLESPEEIQDLIETIREEVSVLKQPHWNKFQNAFSHIFAGGYAAGYYSYKWSEVLSADAYSAFENILDNTNYNREFSQLGNSFLKEILSVGGSRPAIESFRAFRGRDPELDALLRHNGMVAKSF